MPRQPTGNPRGRPRGSGLGVGDAAPRLTVRLPAAVHERLHAFAAQYRSHRGDPPLAVCVREMILFCLDHPDLFRQPTHIPRPTQPHGKLFRQPEDTRSEAVQERSEHSWQPIHPPRPSAETGETFRQAGNAQEPSEETVTISWQPETITAPAAQTRRPYYRRPENASAFDATRYFVGALCLAGHRYQGQEGSLRYRHGEQVCVTCRRERNARYNARKRDRQAWRQTTPQRR